MRIFYIKLSILLLIVPAAVRAERIHTTGKKTFNIQGKLNVEDASSYRIAVIQSDGKSTIAKVAENRKFRFKLNELTSQNASIHAVAGSGRYMGPIVAPQGKNALTRLSGDSGNLGNLKVSNGFITVSKTSGLFSSKNKVSFNQTTGTPGSGNFGLVLSGANTKSTIGIKSGANPGDDTDKDGIPNLIDVDDDGNLILDTFDSNFVEFDGAKPYLFSNLVGDPSNTVNANAQSVSQDTIDNFVKDNLSVVVGYNSKNDGDIQSANVDCLGLPYCGTNGLATIYGLGGIDLPSDFPVNSLWSTFDSDSDGFPNLYVYPEKTRSEIIIKPNVTTSQIGPGDSLLFKINFAKESRTYPLVLSYIFVTVPAAISVNDGTTTTSLTYPGNLSSPAAPGNPIHLASKSLTINYWRPQRAAIQGAESGTLIDMGNLKYGVDLSVQSQGANGITLCEAEDFSGLSSTLSLSTGSNNGTGVLVDSRADGAPDSTQTLSFTVNLESCLTRKGISSSGVTVLVGLKAFDKTGSNGSQLLSFVLP
jgi:hypothetical protein